MLLRCSAFCALAFAGLSIAAVNSHAALTAYTSAAEFASATMMPGADTFDDLLVGGLTTSPISRSAGSYGYSAASPGDFFATAATGHPYLSPNVADDPITFYDFTPTVRGVAGNFFGSDIDGLHLPGLITVIATDSLGATALHTINAEIPLVGEFLGFVSDTSFTSIAVTASQENYALWPTLSMLTLATAPAAGPFPVPEPPSWIVLVLGLGVVGLASRSRGAHGPMSSTSTRPGPERSTRSGGRARVRRRQTYPAYKEEVLAD